MHVGIPHPPGPGTAPRANTPLEQAPSRPGTPPGVDTPDWAHPPRSGIPRIRPPTPRDQVTLPRRAEHAGRSGQQAGGTHPTGMQSCILIDFVLNV